MRRKAGIIGASGYAGFELIKILSRHKGVSLDVLNSRTFAGKTVSSLYPKFKDNRLKFTDFSAEAINELGLDVLFMATPNGEAMKRVPQLTAKVVDLSADYRFRDRKQFERIYGIPHSDATKAVYGLPELYRQQIKKARLVANPGCYATASILAGLPIQEHARYIVFDCKSGYSGAGRESVYAKDSSLLDENIVAYKLTRHRHKYEIEQFIQSPLSFTPHVLPAFRGLMCTAHILLKKKLTPEAVKAMYKRYYAGEKFVKVVDHIPDIREVQNTNECRIGGFEIDENDQLAVVAVEDNLLKGASGQAVQNMNLMLGFKEDEGLR